MRIDFKLTFLINSSCSAGGDRAERDEKLKKDIDKDPSVIQGNEVFSETGGKYSIELQVKNKSVANNFEPIRPVKTGRRRNAFADIPTGNVFVVVLRNYTKQEAAVNLTLDGIPSFAFSEKNADTVYWLVPPATENGPGMAIIRGWDKNDSESFEFKTVAFPESAARKLKIAPNDAIGQICAQFSEATPATLGSRAVGVGDVIQDKKKSVPRTIGALQATIHVRYERSKGEK